MPFRDTPIPTIIKRFRSPVALGILAIILTALGSCKKQKVELSSDKYFTAFTFDISNNPGVLAQTVIGADSVNIGITPGTPLSSLTPLITFIGKSISPSATSKQDFTHPVNYTITAQDGSTKTYVVAVHYLSAVKIITSFIFKAADNPGILTKDIVGTITNDTIVAIIPPGTDVSKLVPDITYSSHTMVPANKTAQDFNGTVGYTLTADDLSSITYKVMTGSPGTIYFGDQAGYLYALDNVTGHVKWKFKTGGVISQTPAIYKNMIIVGSGDSYAYAVDTAKGTLVWKGVLDGGADGETPDVANGMVYFSGGNLAGVDANTGKEVWAIGSGYFRGVSMTVSGGTLYVMGGDACYCLIGIDPLTGNQLPENGGSYLGDSNPAVANGILYVQGSEHQMQALSATDLSPLWDFTPTGGGNPTMVLSSDPTVANGMVYFSATSSGNIGVYAADAASGAQKWYFPNGYQRAPLVQNGLIWVTDYGHGGIYVLDAQTGLQKNSWRLLITAITDPFVANNTLLESDNGVGLYAYDPFHGVLKWQFAAAGQVTANPIVIDGNGNIFRPGSSGEQN